MAVIVAAVGVVAAIYFHKTHPRAVTEEDVGIVAAGIAAVAAWLTYRAAAESRTAAVESRRALQLHGRPDRGTLRFAVRDPDDLHAQMGWVKVPDPAPLWAVLAVRGDLAEEFEAVWVADDGVVCAPRYLVVGDAPECYEEVAIKLEGIAAAEEEGPNGVRAPAAAVPSLKVFCRDRQTGARWCASWSFPRWQQLGSYQLRWKLDD
ncbi:hypothetical protein AB0M20_16040 [Actinoplanes sp. NPDC051633]|uniref:hypothetical protein n=1 Tax=Actinoplanes sp. NPDC051633 TaxID=3155670 RepID=UPI0034311E70